LKWGKRGFLTTERGNVKSERRWCWKKVPKDFHRVDKKKKLAKREKKNRRGTRGRFLEANETTRKGRGIRGEVTVTTGKDHVKEKKMVSFLITGQNSKRGCRRHRRSDMMAGGYITEKGLLCEKGEEFSQRRKGGSLEGRKILRKLKKKLLRK